MIAQLVKCLPQNHEVVKNILRPPTTTKIKGHTNNHHKKELDVMCMLAISELKSWRQQLSRLTGQLTQQMPGQGECLPPKILSSSSPLSHFLLLSRNSRNSVLLSMVLMRTEDTQPEVCSVVPGSMLRGLSPVCHPSATLWSSRLTCKELHLCLLGSLPLAR